HSAPRALDPKARGGLDLRVDPARRRHAALSLERSIGPAQRPFWRKIYFFHLAQSPRALARHVSTLRFPPLSRSAHRGDGQRESGRRFAGARPRTLRRRTGARFIEPTRTAGAARNGDVGRSRL